MLYGLLALSQWLWSQSRQYRAALAAGIPRDGPAASGPLLEVIRRRSGLKLASARVPRYLRVMDPGISRRRFEELLIVGFDRVGPVIAIGNPADPRPPIGAGRQYFGHGQWQDEVVRHMALARVIVVSLSDTEALGWELDQIRQRGHLAKVLFIVPPDLSN